MYCSLMHLSVLASVHMHCTSCAVSTVLRIQYDWEEETDFSNLCFLCTILVELTVVWMLRLRGVWDQEQLQLQL